MVIGGYKNDSYLSPELRFAQTLLELDPLVTFD